MSPMMQPMAHQMVAQQQLGSQMLPQGMATQLMSPQMASQLMPQQLAPQMVPQQMAPQQMAAASQMAARQMVPQMVPQLGQHMQQQLAPSQLSGQLSMSTPMYSGYFQRATTPMFPVNPFFQASSYGQQASSTLERPELAVQVLALALLASVASVVIRRIISADYDGWVFIKTVGNRGREYRSVIGITLCSLRSDHRQGVHQQ